MKEIFIDEKDMPKGMETCNIEFEPYGEGFSNIKFKSLKEHDKKIKEAERKRIVKKIINFARDYFECIICEMCGSRHDERVLTQESVDLLVDRLDGGKL